MFSSWIFSTTTSKRENTPPGIELMKNNCLHNVVFIEISKLMMHFSEIYGFQHKNALRFPCIENNAHSFNFRLILLFSSVFGWMYSSIYHVKKCSEKMRIRNLKFLTEILAKFLCIPNGRAHWSCNSSKLSWTLKILLFGRFCLILSLHIDGIKKVRKARHVFIKQGYTLFCWL